MLFKLLVSLFCIVHATIHHNSAVMILAFQWTIDFDHFLMKSHRFGSIQFFVGDMRERPPLALAEMTDHICLNTPMNVTNLHGCACQIALFFSLTNKNVKQESTNTLQ